MNNIVFVAACFYLAAATHLYLKLLLLKYAHGVFVNGVISPFFFLQAKMYALNTPLCPHRNRAISCVKETNKQ